MVADQTLGGRLCAVAAHCTCDRDAEAVDPLLEVRGHAQAHILIEPLNRAASATNG